jgi:hypothetical protein
VILKMNPKEKFTFTPLQIFVGSTTHHHDSYFSIGTTNNFLSNDTTRKTLLFSDEAWFHLFGFVNTIDLGKYIIPTMLYLGFNVPKVNY